MLHKILRWSWSIHETSCFYFLALFPQATNKYYNTHFFFMSFFLRNQRICGTRQSHPSGLTSSWILKNWSEFFLVRFCGKKFEKWILVECSRKWLKDFEGRFRKIESSIDRSRELILIGWSNVARLRLSRCSCMGIALWSRFCNAGSSFSHAMIGRPRWEMQQCGRLGENGKEKTMGWPKRFRTNRLHHLLAWSVHFFFRVRHSRRYWRSWAKMICRHFWKIVEKDRLHFELWFLFYQYTEKKFQ